MRARIIALWMGLLLAAQTVHASADTSASRLIDALGLPAMLAVFAAEAEDSFSSLDRDMLGGRAGPVYYDQMRRLYDTESMVEAMRGALVSGMSMEEREAAVAFFASPTGSRIVALELAARRAISDEDIEEDARAAWADAPGADPELAAQVRAFIETGDMVEFNVAGQLTSQLKFYEGLADGDALQMDESQMFADVWSMEAEIREDTSGWLGAYVMMAQQPLPPADRRAYLEFMQSDAGRAVNAALFAGYDAIFNDISYAMGRIVALHMGSDTL